MHVLIVGAGGAGSMAAWRLARAGHQVTAFEQFTHGHDLGSSHGESRIVRRVYPDSLYTGLMAESFDLWDELQLAWNGASADPEGQRELIRHSGGLFFGPSGDRNVAEAEAALASNNVQFEKLTAGQVHNRFPAFHLPPDTVALYEPTMGYARASRAIFAAGRLAVQAGARIIEDTAVTQIESDGGNPSVVTADGTRHTGDHLLVTAGAWTADFLKRAGLPVPLLVTRQVYVHLDSGDSGLFTPERFPVWIDAGTNMYGFPELAGTPGVKIASHNRGAVCTGNDVDRGVSPEDEQVVMPYAHSRFPDLGHTIVYRKVCLYTGTPDEDFIIDELPGVPNAHIISACSGHGFKFTPLIGQIAAELATGVTQKRDLSRFRLSRFHKGT